MARELLLTEQNTRAVCRKVLKAFKGRFAEEVSDAVYETADGVRYDVRYIDGAYRNHSTVTS